MVDVTGERYGNLVVVRKTADRTKDNRIIWECKCDCGKTTTVSSVDLVTGNTKSCGCLGRNYAKRNLLEGGFYGKNKFKA